MNEIFWPEDDLGGTTGNVCADEVAVAEPSAARRAQGARQ